MREYRRAAGSRYPVDYFRKRRPKIFDVTDLARPEILAKSGMRVFGEASIYQVLREMWAANATAAGNVQNRRQWVVDARFHHALCNSLRTQHTGCLLPGDSLSQDRIVRVNVETDDMDAAILPCGRQLDTGQYCGSARILKIKLLERAQGVVIGYREVSDIVTCCKPNEFGRGECAVRSVRMSMQVEYHGVRIIRSGQVANTGSTYGHDCVRMREFGATRCPGCRNAT